MKLSFAKKLKIFLITALVLLLAGMTVLGVLGFNQNLDNKKSYEMQVSVDQIFKNSVEVLKTSSNETLKKVYGSPKDEYSFQEMKDGSILIYKFNFDVTGDIATIKTSIQSAIDENLGSGVTVDVKVYENYGDVYSQTAMAVLAIGIAVVVIFAYALLMNKLAGGVAVLCSSVLSALLFTALIAITRIPAQPFFAILAGATAVLASAISLVLTTKYKEAYKSNAKATALEITEKINASLRSVFIIISVVLLLTAVVVGAIGLLNSLFIGLGILVAGIAGVLSAVYMTPFIYSLIKGNNK